MSLRTIEGLTLKYFDTHKSPRRLMCRVRSELRPALVSASGLYVVYNIVVNQIEFVQILKIRYYYANQIEERTNMLLI